MGNQDRTYEHYVFQNLDLRGNDIVNVDTVSSNSDLTIKSQNSETGKVVVASKAELTSTLDVIGKTTLNEDTEIASGKTLTISGVEIKWDSASKSLVFTNKNNS